MLNDLLENKSIKCITPSYNMLQKYMIPCVLIIAGVIGTGMFIISKEYFNLIFVLPIFLAVTYYIFWDFKRIADKVYIDYAKKEFIFLFKIKNKLVRRNFNDMISVKRQIFGHGVELVFEKDEKFLLPFLKKSPYQEIKFILDNRMGEFLTKQEEFLN